VYLLEQKGKKGGTFLQKMTRSGGGICWDAVEPREKKRGKHESFGDLCWRGTGVIVPTEPSGFCKGKKVEGEKGSGGSGKVTGEGPGKRVL